MERLRSQREMRFRGDERLYIPSRRIRTRNNHSAKWLPRRGSKAKREEQRNCLKHLVGRIDVFEILPTGFGKSLIFQLFLRIKIKLEWRQDRMPFTIVVVTLLIAIMKDQVEHLNIIGVKRGSCEIVYWSSKSWLSKEWTKGLQERKGWKASCDHRNWRGSLNHRIVNFPFNCCALSLLELTAFFRN